MYDVIYDDDLWWIAMDGQPLKDIGGFIDPLTPELIIKEIEYETQNQN